MRKIIKITAFSFVLMTLLCLFASCRDQKPKKEVFQIFKEYDDVDFDVDEYIEKSKKSGKYIADSAFLSATDKTDGKLKEFMISIDKEIAIWGVVYDSVESAQNAYPIFIGIESWPCRSPYLSIVRINNVILGGRSDLYLNSFKYELENILHSSVDDGMHELLFDSTEVIRYDKDKSVDEIVGAFKGKGYDRVYYYGNDLVSYKFLNKSDQVLELCIYKENENKDNNMTYEELLSLWEEIYKNAKIVYSYKNGLLIAVIGVTVDPEPLLK